MIEALVVFFLWRITRHVRGKPRNKPVKDFFNEKMGFYGPVDVVKHWNEDYWWPTD